jgi:TolA-binding protein
MVFSGCQSMPPPGQLHAVSSRDDPYEGWLFRGLTGQSAADAREKDAARTGRTTPQVGESSSWSSPDAPRVAASTSAGAASTATGAGSRWNNNDDDPLAPPPKPEDFNKPVDDPLPAKKTPYRTPSSKLGDEEESSFLAGLAPSKVYKNLKAAVGLGPNESIARQSYREGLDLFREKKYAEAATKFAAAAERWPDSALEEDSLFMLGESHFFDDRYPHAQEAYETLLKKYEYSRYLDRAVAREFVIGRYWEDFHRQEPHWPIAPNLLDKKRPLFDTNGNALKAYERVRMNDPAGPLADDAVMVAGISQYRSERWEEATRQFDILRKEYPKSEHQLKAHLLGIDSKLRTYQGAGYDGTPLKEAGDVTDQTLLRFDTQLAGEKSRVIDTKNHIVEQQAERDLTTGLYYQHRKYYGAARFYYNAVIREFPQSKAAQAAKQHIDAIQGLPDEPPDYLHWLTKVFRPKKRQ